MWNTIDIQVFYLFRKMYQFLVQKFSSLDFFIEFFFFMQEKIVQLIPEVIITTNMIDAIITAVKFLLLIAMLIFIRGGIPRYRYDFLTKIGWIKFLSLILSVFLSTLVFIYTM